MKISLTLETGMKKLFKTKKSLVKTIGGKTTVGTTGVPDAQIILLKAPYIQYEQLTLATNFRQYLETIFFKGFMDGNSKNTLSKNT